MWGPNQRLIIVKISHLNPLKLSGPNECEQLEEG